MLKIILLGALLTPSHAEEYAADATIIVESRRNMVVYVEDRIIDNKSQKLKADFNSDTIVGFVNSHARLGKVKNLRGAYEPVTMHTDKIEVYE